MEFESQVLGKGVARTHALETLIILGFLRGLSVRDVVTFQLLPCAPGAQGHPAGRYRIRRRTDADAAVRERA